MFTGKVVLITAACSGIGAVTAVYFANFGASLSLTGSSVENLTSVASECEKLSKVKPLVIVADLNDEEETKNIIESTVNHFDKLDILINNAGILEIGSIETTSLEQFDSVFDTNVRSVYHLTMLAVPHLIKTKGNIVNVSSLNGIRSFPGVLAYNMSKSAIDQFTRCTALELSGKHIRVNGVNPGLIITKIDRPAGMSDEAYNEFVLRTRETHVLGRLGRAEEVADAIAFLASDRASFITGVNLPVDGGRHAMCSL